MKTAVLLFAAAMSLAGCQSVRTTTTAFHNIEASTPTTFTVRAAGPQAGSLESESYAKLIANELLAHGWSQSPNGSIDVTFAYAIDGGRRVSSTVPVYGQTGGGTTYSRGTVYGAGGSATYTGTSYTAPTFGVVGSQQVDDVVYARALRVAMTQKGDGRKVYEASVTSSGSSDTFSQVAPCLIAGLFKNFPGESGKTYSSEVPMSACAPQ